MSWRLRPLDDGAAQCREVVVMVEPTDRRRLLVTARDRFLEGRDSYLRSVPAHVAASWRRCVSSGVQPDVVSSEYFTDVDFGSRLVHCAQPVMGQVAEQIADMPMCLALTDNQVRLLTRRDSDPEFGRLVERVCFARSAGGARGRAPPGDGQPGHAGAGWTRATGRCCSSTCAS